MDRTLSAAIALHDHAVASHWGERGLAGPDPGIRFNYRIGRFIKSALGALPWRDTYSYLQTQGYWILGNWRLFALTGEAPYRDIALRCAEYVLAQQRGDGAWEYPNPEWKGRIATTEGVWASLGLLETYRRANAPAFLEGALKWHAFLTDVIGFQRIGDEVSANYFAHEIEERVPNCSADVLRYLAEMRAATDSDRYLHDATGLLTFLQRAQKPSGEFPYSVAGLTPGKPRPHFQCYQYNAFQCLNLMRYHELTGDGRALPIIAALLRFLRGGLSEAGRAYYECGNRYREVTYHTAALAAAFARASDLGFEGYRDLADRAYTYLLHAQHPGGGFPHSRRDYHLLRDNRSYPRYLAMILYFLLVPQASLGAPRAIPDGTPALSGGGAS